MIVLHVERFNGSAGKHSRVNGRMTWRPVLARGVGVVLFAVGMLAAPGSNSATAATLRLCGNPTPRTPVPIRHVVIVMMEN